MKPSKQRAPKQKASTKREVIYLQVNPEVKEWLVDQSKRQSVPMSLNMFCEHIFITVKNQNPDVLKLV